MSQHEEMILFEKISEEKMEAQRRHFERKANLGEKSIIADSHGPSIEVQASEILRIRSKSNP